jgi:osmoprotectant transport system permease protein
VTSVFAQGPVIPEFERASDCIRENRQFCFDWFMDNFDRVFVPRLIEHIELTAIAVGIGFAISFTAALISYSRGWFETPFAIFAAFLYTIPSLAEIALVSYTLLSLFRNTLTGLREVPEEARVAARAMGLTQWQLLRRVELPLALPAIMAGVRIATVTTISLATVAAFIGVGGLGQPIFNAIQSGFKTQFVGAGLLAVLLALAADGLLVLLQRSLAPWMRAQRA